MNNDELLALIKHCCENIKRTVDGLPYEIPRKADYIKKSADRIIALAKELT